VTILAELGNLKDFSSAEKLAAWTGIIPGIYQSAEKFRTGSIKSMIHANFDGS